MMKNQSYRYWTSIRKIIQYLTLILFFSFFLAAATGWLNPSIVNLGMRLDPLIAFTQFLANKKILAGMSLGLFVLALSFIFGRAWCGWICPLGTTFDLLPAQKAPRGKSIQPKDPPEKLRLIKYLLLFLVLAGALWGNLTLLIFDPLTVLFRSFTVAIWPAIDQIVRAAEAFLYRLPLISNAITEFDAWARTYFLPINITYTRNAFLFLTIFFSIIALNQLAPRFWCRYVCPLGALLGLVSKVSILRKQVSPDCKGCKLCSAACPTGTIDAQNGFSSDPGECTLCLDCLDVCPRSSIKISAMWKPSPLNPAYDPNRRQAIFSFLTASTAVALFHSDWTHHQPDPFHLRPPGSEEDKLLSQCTRCGVCLRACPTNALSPASLETGIEGLWTPVLVPRIGYCDYACNRCGQVCPTDAIPQLSLDEKHNQMIGKAYIDQNRCLAWADHIDCIVCEEMCPLPEKAIYLEVRQVINADGSSKLIQLPLVQRERCIGCGVCEYKCPLKGEAAIRVRLSD